MKRIGIFVDVNNLYYQVKKRYDGRKVDYKAFYNYVRELGDIQIANAYSCDLQTNTIVTKFINCLQHIGFKCLFKEVLKHNYYSWDCGITTDILKALSRLDLIILGSSSNNFAPLLTHIRDMGIDIIIIASNINKELRTLATRYIEIPESFLEQPNVSMPDTSSRDSIEEVG